MPWRSRPGPCSGWWPWTPAAPTAAGRCSPRRSAGRPCSAWNAAPDMESRSPRRCARAANAHVPLAGTSREDRTEWIWLLHDDSEPAPDALEQLLAGAREAPAAAVFGPKVRDWSDRDVLLEAGLSIDRAGRRVTGLEPREADQGQHDGDRDVLAVSSAGMLARRDVWDHVGGFDPSMRLFREDTDFCWRAQAAGYRVRVITNAVVYHVEASARNRREPSAALRPRRQDRHNALMVLAGNLPARPMLSALVGNLVLSTLRTVF